MFSIHGKIALVTLAFLAVAAVGLYLPPQDTQGGGAMDVGIEHARPLSVEIALTEGTQRSLIDVDLKSDETSYLTVPSSWERTEVRRAPLSSVTGEEASQNMRRWTLPANAGISFSVKSGVPTLRLHNPSGAPVKVGLTRVNLSKNESSYDAYLLTEGSIDLP